MRNIKFPSRLYFKRYKINPNDLPMTPTRIFSFVCTVSIFIHNDVVVTGALVNVRCPMKVDRCGRLVVNPWTTVQHKTIIIVTIVERLQVKYILLFLLYILFINYTPMWIFTTNLPTNMKVAGAGMPNQRCALGVAAFCRISASPPTRYGDDG